MNHIDHKLSKALRHLASSSPQGAPPDLEARLNAAFRDHHVRRRRARATRIAVIAACFALVSVLMVLGWRSPKQETKTVPSPNPHRVAIGPALAESAPPDISQAAAVRIARRKPATLDDDFVRLPAYDSPPVDDELRIVRLQIAGATLGVLGMPVKEELSDQRVTAEFVVGTDGTPYAVRLLR